MNQHTRIMCAVDLSWRSEGAFNCAVAIAKSRRAPLDVLFAVPIGIRLVGGYGNVLRSWPTSVDAFQSLALT